MFDKTLTYLGRKFELDIHYFVRGGFWLFLSQVIIVSGSLLGTIVFARILSETEYGLYRYLGALAVLFGTFSLSGIGQSILQTASKGHQNFFPYAIKLSLVYNIGITISALIGTIYYYFNSNLLLAIGCILIALFQPFIAAFQNTTPLLQGLRRFKESTFLQAIKVVFITCTGLLIILLTTNVLVIFLVYLFSQTLANIVGSLWFSERLLVTGNLNEDIRKKYTAYAKHVSVQNIIIGIATRIDSVLVFQQLGAANLAVFSIATIIPDQIKGASKNLLSLITPKLAKHQSLQIIREKVPYKSLQFFIALFLLSFLLIIILPVVYYFLFPKYIETVIYAQILLLGLPASIYLIPLSALQSQLKDRELYVINIFSALFQVLITVILIYTLGLLGAILSRILSRYFQTILTFVLMFSAKD